jgi:HlyD family secretion protein
LSATPQSGTFREKALEHRRSPERLDQLMQVVTLANWIPLAALALLGAILLVWSFTARIPITVQGKAALIYPLRVAGEAQVVQIESRGTGPLADLRVQRGDRVAKGQIIAVIDLPQTRMKLQALRTRLASVEAEAAARRPLEEEKLRVDRETIAQQQHDLAERIRHGEALARSESLNSRARLEAENELAELRSRLRDLGSKEKGLRIAALQAATDVRNRIRDLQAQIEGLESELRTQGLVMADYDGRVLEVAGIVGHVVNQGAKLAALQIVNFTDGASPSTGLQGLAYFSVGDGKRIQPGMTVQLTPATVKREEYGGIVGRVRQVSAFPVSPDSAANLVNSAEVAADLTRDGHTIEVFLDLQPDSTSPSGYKWSAINGPALPITAGTTGEARVTIGRIAPISLILPAVRSVGGH